MVSAFVGQTSHSLRLYCIYCRALRLRSHVTLGGELRSRACDFFQELNLPLPDSVPYMFF